MSSLSAEKDLFKELHSFLVTTGKLGETDANIYVLALKKGVIKSSDVSNEFPEIRPTTALARLRALVNQGFLEFLPKETASKRPYAINFKAVYPRIALRAVVEKSKELPYLLERYDEHWEFLAEKPKEDTETWLAKSARTAISIGASMLNGAKQEIEIYSHDCSWFGNIDIQTSLENALSNGVTVTVIADRLAASVANKMVEMGISLYACKNCYGLPFCIIDRRWLFLPTQSGTLSRQYCAIRTNDKYMVDNFLSLFKTILSCSKPWGK